jgi:alkylation response protein AidB-like acyl-CoA dehydrogenase
MFVDYTPAQRAFREEIRAYLDELITDELRAELDENDGGGPFYRGAMQKLGADRWLGVGWPKEHGGLEHGPIEQFIFFDEVRRAGFPVPILTLNTVSPTLLRFGTEAQKNEYLPRILAGKCHFSIGYTEPNAGTDLASLQTTAVRDGDEYVIRGQKMWTSLAGHADYIWLACRTDPSAKAHKGLSILIVPTDSDGIEMSRIDAMGPGSTYAVYYDDVRVPVDNLVGDENDGWQLITSQLNHERVVICAPGIMEELFLGTVEWAKETPNGEGGKVVDLPWVRTNLARVYAGLEVLKLFNWQQAWRIAEGRLGAAEASTIKVYGTEFYIEAARLLMEVHGASGVLHRSSEGAILAGRLEKYYRTTLVLTFGGGTNEVQRDIICQAGLGMPRLRRR